MKYYKFFLSKVKKTIKGTLTISIPILFFIFMIFLSFVLEGYTLEDIGIEGFTLNPYDYCNLTDVDYTAVVLDDKYSKGSVRITEYLTFDVHAASKNNTYKELWRELPEDYVDGLRTSYTIESVTQILPNGTEVPYAEASHMYWEDYDYTESSTKHWYHSNGSGWYPDNDESLLIYIPWTYREKLTFRITYQLHNAALKYNDCSELYLSMYSGNTIKKLNSFKAQILIPNNVMPTSYSAYTFGTSKSRIPFTESSTLNNGFYTFSINLNKDDLKFDYHNRYIEFCLLTYGKDKHIFTKYAPNNNYSSQNVLQECIDENEYYENKTTIYNNFRLILLGSSFILSLILIITAKRKIEKQYEKYDFKKPEYDYEFFREIPSDLDPIFASELIFMKDPFNENREKKEEYSALLLSLVRKNYIKLTKMNDSPDWTPSNTIINIEPIETTYLSSEFLEEPTIQTINTNTGKKVEELTTTERLYYELIDRHAKPNNYISVTDLQMAINSDYEYTNSFVKDIEKKPIIETGILQGYFEDADYDKPKKAIATIAKLNLFTGLLLLCVVNFISYFTPLIFAYGAYTILGAVLIWRYFYLITKSSNMLLFTQYGIDEQAKWYGLYNFLNSDTLINEKNITDLVLWEKYLIYATAFGISEKVIKVLQINAIPTDLERSTIMNSHSYVHSSHFHSTSRAFGRSIHTSSRGGGFGGHGYGGGGRGGGGGGGGH